MSVFKGTEKVELYDEEVIVKKTGSKKVKGEEGEDDVIHYTYDIISKGKKVGELDNDDYFGLIHGTLFGRNLPDLSHYDAPNIQAKLHRFLKSNTGKKWLEVSSKKGEELDEAKRQQHRKPIKLFSKPQGSELKEGISDLLEDADKEWNKFDDSERKKEQAKDNSEKPPIAEEYTDPQTILDNIIEEIKKFKKSIYEKDKRADKGVREEGSWKDFVKFRKSIEQNLGLLEREF